MVFFLMFGRGHVVFFLFGRVHLFVCCLGWEGGGRRRGGRGLFLLFGQGAFLFCCLDGRRVVFFAVGAGNGSSLTYRPAWLGVDNKKPNKKKYRFHLTAATLEQPLHNLCIKCIHAKTLLLWRLCRTQPLHIFFFVHRFSSSFGLRHLHKLLHKCALWQTSA